MLSLFLYFVILYNKITLSGKSHTVLISGFYVGCFGISVQQNKTLNPTGAVIRDGRPIVVSIVVAKTTQVLILVTAEWL